MPINYLSWSALALGLLGLLLIFGGLTHIFRRHGHTGRGVWQCGIGLVPLFAGLCCALLAIGLQGYHNLTAEQNVATLHFAQLTPNSFNATLTYPDGRSQTHILVGDDWRLEAQFLKWHASASLLGIKPMYRLERLTGRYLDASQEQTAPRSVVSLPLHASNLPLQLDLWQAARERAWLSRFIDASYGSATYLPMQDKVSYQVSVTNSGLLARKISP